MEIQINGRMLTEFSSLQEWVNKASSRLAGVRNTHHILCLDKEGYACTSGADFMAARDADRFPVKVYTVNLGAKGTIK